MSANQMLFRGSNNVNWWTAGPSLQCNNDSRHRVKYPRKNAFEAYHDTLMAQIVTIKKDFNFNEFSTSTVVSPHRNSWVSV